jgi:hypothetical protein
LLSDGKSRNNPDDGIRGWDERQPDNGVHEGKPGFFEFFFVPPGGYQLEPDENEHADRYHRYHRETEIFGTGEEIIFERYGRIGRGTVAAASNDEFIARNGQCRLRVGDEGKKREGDTGRKGLVHGTGVTTGGC